MTVRGVLRHVRKCKAYGPNLASLDSKRLFVHTTVDVRPTPVEVRIRLPSSSSHVYGHCGPFICALVNHAPMFL